MSLNKATDNFLSSADTRVMLMDPQSTQALLGTHRMNLTSLWCTYVWNTFRAPETPAKSWLTEHPHDPCLTSAAATHLLKWQWNDWTELKEDWNGNHFRNKLTWGVKVGACVSDMVPVASLTSVQPVQVCCPAFSCCPTCQLPTDSRLVFCYIRYPACLLISVSLCVKEALR